MLKRPKERLLWTYLREDGCELEIYAFAHDEAIRSLIGFGITRPDPSRLRRTPCTERNKRP